MRVMVSYKEWQRLDAALELILKWEPNYRPNGGGPTEIYDKLEQMGLLSDFKERYRNKILTEQNKGDK